MPPGTLLLLRPPVIAHGIGDAADLGVPLGILLLTAGGAVVATATMLSARAAAGSEQPRRAEAPLPGLLDDPGAGARGLWSSLLALAVAVTFVTGIAGDPAPGRNPAPLLFFSVLWGALPALSALAGPVWRAGNPWRLVARPVLPVVDRSASLARLGIWPAAGALAVLAWFDVVARPGPIGTAVVVLAYGTAMVAGAARYGPAWFSMADPLEAWSVLAGRLSPFARDRDGRLSRRRVRASLATLPSAPGLLAVVAFLLAADLFAAVQEAGLWPQVGRAEGTLLGTALFAASVAGVWLLAGFATRRRPYLVPALLPMAVGSAVARHLAPLLLDGQAALILLSDPLGLGWDLLGRADGFVDVEIIPVGAAIAVQLAALAGGHALAVVAAHDRTIARHDLRTARALQLPFRMVVVASALGFVALRFGA